MEILSFLKKSRIVSAILSIIINMNFTKKCIAHQSMKISNVLSKHIHAHAQPYLYVSGRRPGNASGGANDNASECWR